MTRKLEYIFITRLLEFICERFKLQLNTTKRSINNNVLTFVEPTLQIHFGLRVFLEIYNFRIKIEASYKILR